MTDFGQARPTNTGGVTPTLLLACDLDYKIHKHARAKTDIYIIQTLVPYTGRLMILLQRAETRIE